IKKDDCNKQIENTNNIVMVKRSNTKSTKTMCFNEDVCDAIDDLCDILSEWNALLLSEYNRDPDIKCIDNIKDLLKSKNNAVWDKIVEKAQKLGEVTAREISAMGIYKLTRNHGVHKGKTLPRNDALERLNIASADISQICKQGFKKCIEIINNM
ncbi:1694_t:CDS:2, partial [Funneliformis caledonium]